MSGGLFGGIVWQIFYTEMSGESLRGSVLGLVQGKILWDDFHRENVWLNYPGWVSISPCRITSIYMPPG